MTREIIQLGTDQTGTCITLEITPHNYLREASQMRLFVGNVLKVDVMYIHDSVKESTRSHLCSVGKTILERS